MSRQERIIRGYQPFLKDELRFLDIEFPDENIGYECWDSQSQMHDHIIKDLVDFHASYATLVFFPLS